MAGVQYSMLPPLDDRAIARRRAEVLENSLDQGSPPKAEPAAVGPGERKRALHELAEEMELMFVEKTGR